MRAPDRDLRAMLDRWGLICDAIIGFPDHDAPVRAGQFREFIDAFNGVLAGLLTDVAAVVDGYNRLVDAWDEAWHDAANNGGDRGSEP